MALACLRTQSERQAGQARGDACRYFPGRANLVVDAFSCYYVKRVSHEPWAVLGTINTTTIDSKFLEDLCVATAADILC
jgi:hypothetical protein